MHTSVVIIFIAIIFIIVVVFVVLLIDTKYNKTTTTTIVPPLPQRDRVPRRYSPTAVLRSVRGRCGTTTTTLLHVL